MFSKFAEFFIKNDKLTFVILIIVFFSGVMSYIALPKQYNPEIIAPAFSVSLGSSQLDIDTIQKFVIAPLENKLMELEGIDEIYSTATSGSAQMLVKFHVGTGKEDAKVRLKQKIEENLGETPLGVSYPLIQSIDPDDLPQITFALSYSGSSTDLLGQQDQYIYLRNIAQQIKEKLKTIPYTSTFEIYGGLKNTTLIEIDSSKIIEKGMSYSFVYNSLQEVFQNQNLGETIYDDGRKIYIGFQQKSSIEEIENFPLLYKDGSYILLKDVAQISSGEKRISHMSYYGENSEIHNTVFLSVGKQIGTNAVVVTDEIKAKIQEISLTLPQNISIDIVQDEGATAKAATNMLMLNLFQSIFIVFIVLSVSLGIRNALNTAITIPLTLFGVFGVSLLLGENINRITLFALILVLGMLVDDSTVVVENINRNLSERKNTGKTKLEAITHAIKEVELGVILSTVTRLLAFGAMFFVTGMMGEYMGPIPKFAIIASIISTGIALSINPFISYFTAKEISESDEKIKSKKSLGIRKKYISILAWFIKGENSEKRIGIFKKILWLTLIVIITVPIGLGVFKARMLPKSNQNQIYLWIDAPRNYDSQKSQKVIDEVYSFFFNSEENSQNIVKNISVTSGQAYPSDFGNLFRGGMTRIGENQMSFKINLHSERNGISSEEYTIEIRDHLKERLLSLYPDLKIRLLEDPPGPPNRATFLVKIKGDNTIAKSVFFEKVYNEISKIQKKYDLVDIETSKSSTYEKMSLNLKNSEIKRLGISANYIENEIQILLNGKDIALDRDAKTLEIQNIRLSGNIISPEILKNMSIILPNSEKILLASIIDFSYTFVPDDIYSDNREISDFIYAEMGNNSLIYPVIALFSILRDTDFLGKEYRVVSWNPYKIIYQDIKNNESFIIEFGGEWETTLDTFKELGIAMMISILSIYFMLVGQFRSFSIAGIIMMTFLLGFYGVFPGFTILYLLFGEYFSATSMIGVIALAGIVVGNAIMMIEYVHILKENALTIEDAILHAAYTRAKPILLTSLTTILGAMTILGDPVWSGLAWSIITGLAVSSILTLFVIPLFYYKSQKKYW